MSFNPGDRVVFINAKKHEREPYFYPAPGTIGTVLSSYGSVQWPEGSCGGECKWVCDDYDMKLFHFKVGDKVIGNDEHAYCITKKGWTGVVTSVERDWMWVQGDEDRFYVRQKYFDLVERKEPEVKVNEYGQLICAECGCVIEDKDDAIEIDGEFYCQDCVDREFAYCEQCNEYHRADKVIEVDGRMVCEDCLHYGGRYFQCDDCGEWHDALNNDYIRLANGYWICEGCANSGDYHRCEDCGEWFHEDDMTWDEDDEEWYCDQCYREHEPKVINDYSFKPDPIFKAHTHDTFFTDKDIKELLFGVELEIDKGDDAEECASDIIDDTEDIYCKHDGSLSDGVEIVSHPCTLEYHMKSLGWGRICEIAKHHDFKSQDARTCGLHIHVGRNQMGGDLTEQRETAGKLVLLVDRHWDSLVKFSRRTGSQLNHWAIRPRINFKRVSEGTSLAQAGLNTIRDGRYQAVNLENDATVEFRMFCGTLKVETIYATLQLVSNIVTYAKEHDPETCMASTWQDITGVQEFDELKDYLKNRGLVEGLAPTEREWQSQGEVEITTDRKPEVGDTVVIINDDGEDVDDLRYHMGETARVVEVTPGFVHDLVIDFGAEGAGTHSCGGRLPRWTGYRVHFNNVAVVAA